MRRPTARRTVSIAAAVAVVAAASGVATAQASDILGTVTFEGGAVIPAGQVEIHLEGLAHPDATKSADTTHAESDGKSDTISFSLSLPADAMQMRSLEVVARLERADGWLLARGSAEVKAGAPIRVTLHPAMY